MKYNNYKKMLAVILTISIIAATGMILTGCGEEKNDVQPTSATTTETAAPTTAPTQ